MKSNERCAVEIQFECVYKILKLIFSSFFYVDTVTGVTTKEYKPESGPYS